MGRLNPIERRLERFMREPPSVRNAAGVIVIATFVVVVGAGVLMTLIDGEEYPDLGERIDRRFDEPERKLDVLMGTERQ